MPTATPLTAATSGFVAWASSCMKRKTAWPSAFGGAATKSSMSLPAQKTSGAPWISTTRTAPSVSAACSASAIAAYIALVMAFFLAGRSMRIVSTPPLFSVPMSMQVSSRRRSGEHHCAYNPPMDRDGFIASVVLVVVFAAGLRAVRDSFWRVALLSLPGTIAHELSHLVVGYALGARPQRFSLWPRREGK